MFKKFKIVVFFLIITTSCVTNPNRVYNCGNREGFFTCITFINKSGNIMHTEPNEKDIIESITIHKPDGKYVEKYKDGKLKCRYFYSKKGKKEKECYADKIDTIVDKNNKSIITKIVYFKSMNIKSKITFTNGEENVNEKSFYENGIIEFEKNYKNKNLHGLFTAYHKNGKLALKVNYINNKKEGIEKGFYVNGKKAYIANYKNGKLNGSLLQYSKNEKLIGKFIYKNGLLSNTNYKYYENGNIFVKSNYKNGKLNGKITFYHENGNIKCNFIYKNDKRISENCDANYPEFKIK